MTNREYVKTQIDTLPDDMVKIVIEFVEFQQLKRREADWLAELEDKLDEAARFEENNPDAFCTHEELFSRLRSRYG
ncbi:MAG: hypothetical protein FWD35_01065 [Oscillospiraceae bacterium]|nr:hypothetical protein [Oscillospiraceae bacterium]